MRKEETKSDSYELSKNKMVEYSRELEDDLKEKHQCMKRTNIHWIIFSANIEKEKKCLSICVCFNSPEKIHFDKHSHSYPMLITK